LAALIRQKQGTNRSVLIHDTICRQVANRGPHLRDFARKYDVVIYVSGRKSSNGAALFQICREANAKAYSVENADELKTEWFDEAKTAGICGATSTPMWLMEQVARWIEDHICN
jgi:4-hydroxy-3-methylbut-2-enyl diphosphate reductase